MDDIAKLVGAARNDGDSHAFGELVQRFWAMAYGVAFSKLGDAHLAEDAAQEAFIEAYCNLAKLKCPQAFAGWFRVILLRRVRRVSVRRAQVQIPPGAPEHLAPSGLGPSAVAEANETKDELRKALASLPATPRLMMTLYYTKDYKTAEIARFLGLTLTAVKKRLHDARSKLKQRMASLMPGNLRRPRPSKGPRFRGAVRARLERPGKAQTSAVMSRPTQLTLGGGNPVKLADPAVKKRPLNGPSSEGPSKSRPTLALVPARHTSRAQVGDNEHLRELWLRYKEKGGDDLRNRILEQYLHLIRHHAQRLAAKLPDEVEPEDLNGAGVFGLMDAIEAFDPDRGVKFETYCARRIRGAMLDELRALDWAPRLVRSRARQIIMAREAFEKQYGRPPTDDEIGAQMDLSPRDYARVRQDSEVVGMISLARKRFETDSDRDICELDMIKDPGQADPFTAVQRLNLKQAILHRMSRAERLIVVLYYYEQMTMKEVGQALDLSESRVSQMHSSIMKRLKIQFGGGPDEMLGAA